MINPLGVRRLSDPQLARRAEYLASAGRWDEILAEKLEHFVPRGLIRQLNKHMEKQGIARPGRGRPKAKSAKA